MQYIHGTYKYLQGVATRIPAGPGWNKQCELAISCLTLYVNHCWQGSPTMNNLERIPKAPRAMLLSERVRLLEDLVCLKEQNQAAEPPPHASTPVIQIPIPLPATVPSTSAGLNGHPTNPPGPAPPTPSNATTGAIAIPMDPEFFSAVTVSSSSTTPSPMKRLSFDSNRGRQTNHTTAEKDHKRRSASPKSV